ncbi:7991_t:CDS:1, partial [Ambispora leptoticha]
KHNNTADNVIEISNRNISIIDKNGVKITSLIDDIVQQIETPIEINKLYKEFINSEEWNTILQTIEPIEPLSIPESIEIIKNPSEENINHQSPKRKEITFSLTKSNEI